MCNIKKDIPYYICSQSGVIISQILKYDFEKNNKKFPSHFSFLPSHESET